MRRLLFLTVVFAAGSASAADPPLERVRMPDGHVLTAGPARSEALTQEVAALDAKLFDAIFTQCNAEEVAKLVVDDLEFYHDKWGYDPNGDGALEVGVHRFYRVEAGKPDVLTETGRFVQLWKRGDDGRLRLARVISYDHVLAPGAGEDVAR